MTNRRMQIVEVAADLFRRYGYGKTTMANIASGASMSRPTLYTEFPDKDSVFTAVLETMTSSLLADIERRVGDGPTLYAQIAQACSLWALSGYDIVQAHPDARDLFDPRFPAVQASNAAFREFLSALFDHSAGLPAALEPRRLADAVTLSLQGIKSNATSRRHLLDLIETLATSIHDALAAHEPVASQSPGDRKSAGARAM